MKKLFTRTAALTLSAALFLTGLAVAVTAQAVDHNAKAKTIGLTVDDRPLARDSRMNASFAPVVKRTSASVVKVFTTSKMKESPMDGFPFPDNPFFRQFGGNEGGPFGRPQQHRSAAPRQHGLGSGVIVSKDGYILTNNHVVDGADEVKVALQDGREFKAKVVGTDPKTDVAVLKIDAGSLPKMDLADSDKTEVGDVVLAVGNPFGIGQTVTMGIISAKGRATLGLDYEDFIQTDAAINPGNSGGALVDTDGRLIGINTAIYSRSGGNQGIGFAIPTNLARGVMESLIQYGKVTRSYIGVKIQDPTPELAREFKMENDKGAIVGEVVPKGPADNAGIKSGDVIVSFNGKAVDDSRHLKLEVARVKPGTSVPVKILRDGAAQTLNVTLKEMPGDENSSASNNSEQSGENDTLQGVGVVNLDPQARQQFNVPENIQGAIVTQVEMNSAAAEAGLKPGDVIMQINRQTVKNAQDAVRLTEHAKSKRTLLRVWSEGGVRFLVVDENKNN